jgi:hypothetical protein
VVCLILPIYIVYCLWSVWFYQYILSIVYCLWSVWFYQYILSIVYCLWSVWFYQYLLSIACGLSDFTNTYCLLSIACGLSDLLLLICYSLVVFVLWEYILKVHILVSSEHKLCHIWNTCIVSCIYWSIAFLSKLLIFFLTKLTIKSHILIIEYT